MLWLLLLTSSFQEKLHNRGPERTTSVAAVAQPRHRAVLPAASASGYSSDAR
jgi:hypothetical protein